MVIYLYSSEFNVTMDFEFKSTYLFMILLGTVMPSGIENYGKGTISQFRNDFMYNERFSLIVELLKEHNNVGIRTMSSTALV